LTPTATGTVRRADAATATFSFPPDGSGNETQQAIEQETRGFDMTELKAGLIGCGIVGRVHTECLAQLHGMKMVAFCDIVEERASQLCDEFDGEYSTTEADRLFDDKDLSAVYIATRHGSHADLCMRSARAGKHVLIEKPLALTVEQCVEVGRAVEESGVKLFTAFKMRYYELVLKARKLMPGPLMVTMQMMTDRWSDDVWANDPIEGGGNVLSQGCHSCDIMRFVMDSDPIEVYAVGGNYYTGTGVVDNLAAVFRFENGGIGSLVQGDANCPPLVSKFFMQLYAEGKSVMLDKRFCRLQYSEGGGEPVTHEGAETGFLEENRAFIECLLDDTKPAIDHRDGLMATLMVVQACNSARERKPKPIASVVVDI